jgi:hypothetical protein
MSLTQCPNCRGRCFTDTASCSRCYQTFQPGSLEAYAVAEEKAFSAKAHALFLSLFLTWLAVLLLVQIQTHLYGTGN